MKSYKFTVNFIVNPVAGGGKATRLFPRIREVFDCAKAEDDDDFYFTRCPGDATEKAAGAFDIVVAAGGDGEILFGDEMNFTLDSCVITVLTGGAE